MNKEFKEQTFQEALKEDKYLICLLILAAVAIPIIKILN